MVDVNVDTQSSGKYGAARGMDGGQVGKSIDNIERVVDEYTTSLRPQDYLTFAFGSIAVSALLKLTGRTDDAMFVGQWAPSFLALAIYDEFRRGKEPRAH